MTGTLSAAREDVATQDEAATDATDRLTPGSKVSLGALLVATDIVALVLAAATFVLIARANLAGRSTEAPYFVALAGVGATVVAIKTLHLYRARNCSVRAAELSGLMKAVAISTLAVVAVAPAFNFSVPASWAVVLGLLEFGALSLSRSAYAAWLRHERGRGRFTRTVLLLGTGDEGLALARLVRDQPELGLSIVGALGDANHEFPVPVLGRTGSVLDTIRHTRATGALIAATDLDYRELSGVLDELMEHGIHTQLSSGIHGVSSRRLRATPLAWEPIFYVEPPTLQAWQRRTKRITDTFVSSLLVLALSPILLLAAIAIKLGDRGPVIFRQQRIGIGGKPFTVFKFRTMVPGAETMITEIRGANERQGPLFKLTSDPRRTRVGRILELASIDELPQLFNVIRGDMSLVGPRPALASEVAEFDDELLDRLNVRPGITGLWQIEARDNASFDAYRRLDLFYVENWSLTLDLAIIFGTVRALITRVFGRLLTSTGTAEPTATTAVDPWPVSDRSPAV